MITLEDELKKPSFSKGVIDPTPIRGEFEHSWIAAETKRFLISDVEKNPESEMDEIAKQITNALRIKVKNHNEILAHCSTLGHEHRDTEMTDIQVQWVDSSSPDDCQESRTGHFRITIRLEPPINKP